MKLLLLRSCAAAFLLLSHAIAADWTWRLDNGSGQAELKQGVVSLTLSKPGEVTAVTDNIPVQGGKPVNLTFQYTAEGLTPAQPLHLVIHWFDAAGEDVDAARLGLGFPPLARAWDFIRNSAKPVPVADNLTVPDRAVKARLTLRLAREDGESSVKGTAAVQLSGFKIQEGQITPVGIAVAESGPADAGPLSTASSDYPFAPNLISNPALEEGTEGPVGWKIEGDNRNGAALWAQGGAFSGRRAFKLVDVGPYIKSWDKKPGEPYIPGGRPAQDYSAAREEASGRWVSLPSPAVPGTAYQTTAFYWYANRNYLDRGLVNPVRIQFLDAKGNVLRETTRWDDWFKDERVSTQQGWVFAPGKPLVAPAAAKSVRVAVVMFHAFYDIEGGTLRKIPDERGFLLVDNISLYALPKDADLKDPDAAFQTAIGAKALPHVPSSIGHRPNSVTLRAETDLPAGLLMVSRGGKKTKSGTVSLVASNLLGDSRSGTVKYDLVGIDGKSVAGGRQEVTLPPFGSAKAKIKLPSWLPCGPYSIRYRLQMTGEDQSTEGSSRIGLMPPRETTPAERGRMDYPFSLWMHSFTGSIGTPTEPILGKLADAAGVGKTWFGARIYLPEYVSIKDPQARAAAIQKRIDLAKKEFAVWRKYGVTPMGDLEPCQVLDPSDYPVLAEVVGAFVNGLKDDLKIWRYGTETVHGGITELDRATVETGKLSGQGGQNYLYWGRKGTVRQYWAEYFVIYKAAKQADPKCLFGPQSASDVAGDVLRLFFKLGTKADLDSFGMNTYISAFSIWPPNIHELKKNGVPDLPIYVSEFDARHRTSPIAPDSMTQERIASQRMVSYWASVLQSFPGLFHLEQWGMILGDDDGSLTYQKQVRPQYLAFATMTNVLGAGKFIAKYDQPAAEIYVRQRSVRRGFVAMAWSKGPQAPLDLEVGGTAATVIDLWGNRREVAAVDGVVSLSLSPDPVYVVSAHEIKPAAGVRIDVSHKSVDSSRLQIAVSLTNERKKPVSGSLEIVADGPLRVTDRIREIKALASGTTLELLFDVQPVAELADSRVPMRVRFTADGKVTETPAALNFHVARRAGGSDTAKWSDRELSQVANRADQVTGVTGKPWGGPADISARAGFRWDTANLHARFEVTDDVDMPPQSESETFNHDSIELLIDLHRKLASGAPFTMFALARYPDGAHLRRYDGTLPQGEVPGAKITAQHTGNVTVYEIAIPWDEIERGFSPVAGQAIAIDWSVNDYDGSGSGRRQISWFYPTAEKNAAKFGDLILTGD